MPLRPLLCCSLSVALLTGACGARQPAPEDDGQTAPDAHEQAVEANAVGDDEVSQGPLQPGGPMPLESAYAGYADGTIVLADVNSDFAREDLGYIEGALLLSSYQFDPAELSGYRDATLVFYCVNPQCVASRLAAEYALSLGIAHAHHLPAGIMGWRDAGYPIAFPVASVSGE